MADKQVARQVQRQASPMGFLLDLRERSRRLSEEEYLAKIGLSDKLQKLLGKKD